MLELHADGRVEWGHLSAGDHQFGDADRHYDLLPDNDELAMPVGQMPVASAAGPMGRGRSVVQPAWMTQGIPNSQSAAAANPSAGKDILVMVHSWLSAYAASCCPCIVPAISTGSHAMRGFQAALHVF